MNETRNELLAILRLIKTQGKEEKSFAIDRILESFENDIRRKLKDLKNQEEELLNNLETLEYVKKELDK